MLSTIIKSMSVIIPLTLVCGLFAHDTRAGNMLVASVSRFSIVDSYGLNPSKWLHVEHHIHIDKGAVNVSAYSFGSQQPATAPRNQGDKKYISFRRMMGNDFGNGYRWPSI